MPNDYYQDNQIRYQDVEVEESRPRIINAHNINDIASLRGTLYADKQKLGAVFRNLISNAIKFTAPGGSVSIVAQVIQRKASVQRISSATPTVVAGEMSETDEDGHVLRVEVVDSGRGISQVSFMSILILLCC